MSLNLYFLRHGETDHSHEDAFCGTTNALLTSKGKEMAVSFAETYDKMPWTAIYCSPLQRTRDTASPLCERLDMTAQIRDGLKEMDFGLWENQNREIVQEKFPGEYVRWLTDPAWNPPNEGETAVEVASRAALVIAEITEAHHTGNILIVSHKTTIRIILCHLLGIDLGRYRDRIQMPVSALSLVRIDVHGPMLQILGDRTHLSSELQAIS